MKKKQSNFQTSVIFIILFVVFGLYNFYARNLRNTNSVRLNSAECWRFVGYESSKLEKKWLKNIDNVQSLDKDWSEGCKLAKSDEDKLRTWITTIHDDKKSLDSEYFDPSIFSRLKFVNRCNGDVSYSYVEPLAVYLRHPISRPCFKDDNILNKNYILLRREKDILTKHGRNYLFDLGCSTYNDGRGGASQNWFVESYEKRGIVFDRIFGWELEQVNHNKFWSQVPFKVKTKLSFFNVGVNPNVHSDDNPLKYIRDLTNENDFVVLKIDIDHPDTENQFIEQILRDPITSSLIDELYWENHVIGNPMSHMGWTFSRYKNLNEYQNLSSSYNLFHQLRQKGLVAHSWV